MARGLLDQVAETTGDDLTPPERAERDRLNARLADIQPRLAVLTARKELPPDEERERNILRAERERLNGTISKLAAVASRRLLAELGAVQAGLPSETALILWVDFTDTSGRVSEHWVCVVRTTGDPAWERLPGTELNLAWATNDNTLSFRLRTALASGAFSKEVVALSRALHAQRLAPLEKHLAGVKHLIVIPTGAMAGVPVEVLTDKYAISYAPSGTFLARLKDRPQPATAGVLALGDPAYPPTIARKGPAPLPPGGLLVTQVVPGGSAAAEGIKPGDVLLSYAGQELKSVDRLKELAAAPPAGKTVAVQVWRESEGKATVKDLPPGRLGVVLDLRPAPEAIASRRESDALMARLTRGGDWAELPGTAAEIAGLTTLFGEQTTVLTRANASRARVDAFRASGKLSGFRYIHFGTHGEANHEKGFESALILAGDQKAVAPLRAAEVLADWKLNADLVTLSACETGLGEFGGGEGLQEFAQAFLHAGSRAVCLSLWKVDDGATCLLMDRFYRNLLGKRDGLDKPMGKAAALAEAKSWLRGLSGAEAGKLLAGLTKGVDRGAKAKAPELVVPAVDPKAGKDADRPFAHPRYWAAFILIGDPN